MTSIARRFSTALVLGSLLFAVACDKKSDSTAPAAATSGASASSAAVPAAMTATAAAPAAGGGAADCTALLTHYTDLVEASKEKYTFFSRAKQAEWIAHCNKANNLKSHPDVVTCVMAAKDKDTANHCNGFDPMLKEWLAAKP